MLKTFKNIFKKIQKQSIIVQTFLYLIIYLALRSIFKVINWSLWKIQTLEGFGNPPTQMTLFHWNKCGHCKKMMPEWNKFQSSYKGKLKIKKVEQGDNPSLIKKLNVSSYPTILLLDKDNNKVKEYDGGRTAEEFKKFTESL
tara:strand:+ start:3675 stop:4100 length:426 start_codon:yes stop_codon:yes gene_type:complete